MSNLRRLFGFLAQPVRASGRGTGPSGVDLATLSSRYESVVREFYAYLPDDVRSIFVDDAIYHRERYLELLGRTYGARVLELGSDKPFITHFLRELHPDSAFETVSIDIPFSKHPITRIDIESQEFPFEPATFTDVIFTEVLEHLFRDPAWTMFQMNRVMAPGGTMFLTTPNACGYDSLINLINQANPNARSQFFAAIESGHPHLWTADECRDLLNAHGFDVVSVDTADYVRIPKPKEVAEFLDRYSKNKDLHGQSLRIVATKAREVTGPTYPLNLFPEGKPVMLQGALREWAVAQLGAR